MGVIDLSGCRCRLSQQREVVCYCSFWRASSAVGGEPCQMLGRGFLTFKLSGVLGRSEESMVAGFLRRYGERASKVAGSPAGEEENLDLSLDHQW